MRGMALFKALGILIGIVFILGGCAFGKYGKAQMTYSEIMIPPGINPKMSTKTDIINLLGAPDFSTKLKNKEIWVYRNHSGFYLLVYGKVQSKDLVIEFAGDRVDSYRLIDKGEAWGILAAPGSVAK